MLESVINLKALNNNIKKIKSQIKVPLCFVVKADAYGHGTEVVASHIKEDVDEFAVATLDEAIKLYKCGVGKPVNILGCTDGDFAVEWRKIGSMPDIIPTICDKSELKILKTARQVNIKLNTGMNRLGVKREDLHKLIVSVNESGKQVKSIFTHFYNADNLKSATQQFDIFQKITLPEVIRSGGKIKLHCCASNALKLPEHMRLDMARIGIAAYGYCDCALKLEPVMSVSTNILQVFDVKTGEHVGYGDFIVNRDTRVAAARIGYADGYRRKKTNEERFVSINGKLCPVIGQVCMDITLIDVSNVLLSGNDRVYLLGGGAYGKKLAESYNTIIYEVLTGFNGKRIKRSYLG